MTRSLLLLLTLTTMAHAATVTVTVSGVRNNRGHVRVAICPRETFLQPHCSWFGTSPAHPGNVQVSINNVPPGTYAAEAFHDEDDNTILERSFFGLPQEGVGFSNNAPMHFGPPRFDAASFTVDSAQLSISFELKYYN